MVCAECRTFPGEPTCGACRAVTRIVGLLRSGQFTADQEKQVSGILRVAAGELTDLVEQNQGKKEEKPPAPEGETPGPTPGPLPEAPLKVGEKPKEEESYSYGSEEEGESEDANNKKAAEAATSAEPRGEQAEETPAPETADPSPADKPSREEIYREKVRDKFDKNYLTKRLCLTPAPKPPARRSGDKRRRSSSRPRERREVSPSRRELGAEEAPSPRRDSPPGGTVTTRKVTTGSPCLADHTRRSQSHLEGPEEPRSVIGPESSGQKRLRRDEPRKGLETKDAAKSQSQSQGHREGQSGTTPEAPSSGGASTGWGTSSTPQRDEATRSRRRRRRSMGGDYFGAGVQAAGKIQRVEMDHRSVYLYLRLTGTNNEELLKARTKTADQVFKLHVCPPECGRVESGELLLHGIKGRKGRDHGEEAWVTNLEGPSPREDDELAPLRARELAREMVDPPAPVPRRDASPHAPEEAQKKKKQKREKTKEEKLASGRLPAKAVQKDPAQLFSGTALDPKEKVRKRVMKAAQKYASKKKARRSSSSTGSGSSSSSTSDSKGVVSGEGVFTEETKTRALGERYPGALAMETLLTMRRNLLATSGEEGEEHSTRPVALLYFRSVLGRKCSGAQSRELLNISCAIDALLKARPAQALDILCQRLKAQETVIAGTNWAIAQRLELASQDQTTLIARGELHSAQRDTYLDSRAKWQAQTGPGGKNTPKGKNKGKGDSSMKEDRKDDHKRDKGKGGEKK
eukprot:s1098_g21.t1